jgi:hypothetical protein
MGLKLAILACQAADELGNEALGAPGPGLVPFDGLDARDFAVVHRKIAPETKICDKQQLGGPVPPLHSVARIGFGEPTRLGFPQRLVDADPARRHGV